MQVLREVLRVKVGEEQEQDLWQRLKGLYQPLVSDVPGVFRELLELNGMPSGRGGELFMGKEEDILFYWISEARDSVEAGVIFTDTPPVERFEEFRSSIASVLDAWRWTPLSVLSRRFRLVAEESDPFPVAKGQLEAAKVLTAPECRELLGRVSANPGLMLSAFAGDRSEEYAEFVDGLVDKGLLEREFEVFDRDTNRELARFPTFEALQEAAERGFRSPFSNRRKSGSTSYCVPLRWASAWRIETCGWL